ncbi:MAG TPA: hypothetical protein VGM07_04685 [Stellaceae bacterium]|jgi:hypothetical protein
MPGKLTQIWFAAVLACAGVPAHAAGMPDIGTKNFVPGGDAPAYLTNENLAVPPGSPGQSPIGTAYNEPAAPPPFAAAPARAPRAQARGHNRVAADHAKPPHGAASWAAKHRSMRVVRRMAAGGRGSVSHARTARMTRGAPAAAARARTAPARRVRTGVRHAAAKSVARRG